MTANRTPKPKQVQDYKLDEIVTTERHDKDVGDLNQRIAALEEQFGTNEKTAKTICEVAKNIVPMQELFSERIAKSISDDAKVKEAIGALITESDRNVVSKWISRLGFLGWTALVGAVCLAAGAIITNYIGDMGKQESEKTEQSAPTGNSKASETGNGH